MSIRASWRAAARRLGLRRALQRSAQALGFDLVKRGFYSPIPEWRSLPDEVWTRRSALRGIAWDLEAQMAFLERELGPYFPEFRPPVAPRSGIARYHYENGFFGAVDADVLYAFIRHLRPRKVLELGSGYSSLVIGAALARNALEGDSNRSTHDVFDPFSRPDLAPAIRAVADLHLISANDVPLSTFGELTAGDVLFVDTTHTVKLDSDVNFIVLDVLPLLRPGVVVHFHDIFLPWEYPKAWLTEPEVFWGEQYLLQAFLAHNPEYEVLLGIAAALRDKHERVAEVITSADRASGASSFWLRRRA